MSWDDQTIVDNYSTSADDVDKNWYEEKVNIPAILALLPSERVRLLDFGCGPGNFTAKLADSFDATGADRSEAMIRKAQEKYPQIPFLAWDGTTDLPTDQEKFAAIVTKLTLEFVEDLLPVAHHLFDALTPNGVLAISVQHPLLAIAMHPEDAIPYWGTPKFDVQIGTTVTSVTKIHRNLNDYTEPFIRRGFRITKISEPQIPDDTARGHTLRPIDLKFPKRLNILFQKS